MNSNLLESAKLKNCIIFKHIFNKENILWLSNNFYFCNPIYLERWQSGRMRWSWKPLYSNVPGVRIPLSPHKLNPYNLVIVGVYFYIWKMKEINKDITVANTLPGKFYNSKDIFEKVIENTYRP